MAQTMLGVNGEVDRVMGSLLEAKGCRSMHDFEEILMSNAHMIREHDISEQIY